MEVLSVSNIDAQKELISCLPEIIDDDCNKEILRQLQYVFIGFYLVLLWLVISKGKRYFLCFLCFKVMLINEILSLVMVWFVIIFCFYREMLKTSQLVTSVLDALSNMNIDAEVLIEVKLEFFFFLI